MNEYESKSIAELIDMIEDPVVKAIINKLLIRDENIVAGINMSISDANASHRRLQEEIDKLKK